MKKAEEKLNGQKNSESFNNGCRSSTVQNRSFDSILKDLRDPGIEYRGIPFWSWNDKLEHEELKWQIGQMKEAGLGGFFIHARAGLKTPYMSEEWMDCIETCIKEAGSQGLGAWLYDENGYPSGFAGGKIPAMGPEYCQKFLKFEVVKGTELKEKPETLGIYRISGNYERISVSEVSKNEEILHVWYEINPYYADLLDEKVVKAFIESTYEVYYKRFSEYFGRDLPGIFTDEPQYGRTDMPWSFIIPGRFLEIYGYDLLDYLPALYFKAPGFRKIRYDFWNLVEKLFTRGYSRQLSDWCEEHNCQLTGHILLEEDIRYQTRCSGSAMSFYRYMQIPGIDWLGRDIGNPVIVKQVSSVAEQLGKKKVLSEMFAASGWGTGIEELKHIAEWQYVLGINLICAHLEPYSLRGMRKKDHPPALFYQTNWWKDYRVFCDYFARLGTLLSMGGYAPDILIIHPVRSGWTAMDASCYANGTNDELKFLDDSFTELSRILTGLHMDYHYGDEEIIAEYGRVDNGKFVVGQHSYKVVIIPPSITLEPATAELLWEFIEAGGRVYAFEYFPEMINGVESEKQKRMKQHCRQISMNAALLLREMEESGCKRIWVCSTDGKEVHNIHHRVSSYDEGSVLFLVNTGSTESYETEIIVDGYSCCYAIDLKDYASYSVPFWQDRDKIRIKLIFAPSQSYVLLLTKKEGLAPCGAGVSGRTGEQTYIRFGNGWEIRPMNLNVLVLDYCRLSLEGGPWSEPKPVIIVQEELLRLGRSAKIAMEFTVNCSCSFEEKKELYLILEDAYKYSVEINGRLVKEQVPGWWKDKCFQKLNISGMLFKGRNTLVLETNFESSPEILNKIARAMKFEAEANMLTLDSEIENIYLMGEFEVLSSSKYQPAARNAFIQSGGFYLADKKESKCCGEATVCGYPFYSGDMLFEQVFEIDDASAYSSMVFYMDKPNAALARLFINGNEVKSFLWAPYEAEILPWVKNGSNMVSISLVSTDRNLFGPHHHPGGELHLLGPAQFTRLTGWTDSYCFVRFGMGGKAGLKCIRK